MDAGVILDNFDEIPEADEDVVPHGERVIAEDEYYKLTARRLEIKSYFFPSKRSRSISISEIKCIYYKHQGHWKFVTPGWGMEGIKIWWAQDFKRPFRGANETLYNVVVDCGERTMKGFSVTSIDKFLSGMEQVTAQLVYIRDKLPEIF